jgi:LmbE family N-acetylglucosaminyl deacetylase
MRGKKNMGETKTSKKRSRKKYFMLAVIVAFISVVTIYAPSSSDYYYIWRYGKTIPRLPAVPEFSKSDTLLILSPHPDDETLCCAGAIQNATEAGAQVYVVWITAGDGFEWDDIFLTRKFRRKPDMIAFGRRRIAEAKLASKTLGIPKDHLIFLGYPDRGLIRLFFSNYKTPYTSRYTKSEKVPYSEALTPGTLYTGKNLEGDLKSVLDDVKPTIIFMPAPMDAHPDHKATCFFALRSLGARTENITSFFWIVHGGLEWPLPKDWHTDLYLSPPRILKYLGWARLDLSENQILTKRKAILSYPSQFKALGPYMAAFARKNEIFIKQSF